MVRSVNFSDDTFSNLEDLIAHSFPGQENKLSRYISDLVNKEYKLVKPPRHDANQNGIQQQSKPEEGSEVTAASQERDENDNSGGADKPVVAG